VMKRLLLICLLGPAIAAAHQSANVRSIVGPWHYDVNSIRIELTADGKKQMAAEKNGPAQLEAGKAQLKKILAPMTMTFMANHKFAVTSVKDSKAATGTWSMNGRKLSFTSDLKITHLPTMTLGPSNKQIFAVMDQGFAHIYITLVR
jgi:hypothetical protein